jgi:hypothetical protein
MRFVKRCAVAGSLAITAFGLASAWAAPRLAPVSVSIPPHPRVVENVSITLSRGARPPRGGYYYAVVVLAGYRGYSSASPPPCAVSSDMDRTVYGFPHRGRRVHLVLIPVGSKTGRWCKGGSYEGAVYAVPHKPPCSREYPCRSASSEYAGACGGLQPCGVVPAPTERPKPEPPPTEPERPPAPTYTYPGGLPKPLDSSSRIVADFTLRF